VNPRSGAEPRTLQDGEFCADHQGQGALDADAGGVEGLCGREEGGLTLKMVRGTIFSVKRGERDQELVRGTNSPANATARPRGGGEANRGWWGGRSVGIRDYYPTTFYLTTCR
jgi:hypothetical protein